jgi:hypothetical protein
MQNASDNKLSAIDKALAAAKARKAMKEATQVTGDETSALKTPATKPMKKVDDGARAEAKKLRDAEREARRAAKAVAPKGPVHMKKIAKAASKLPTISAEAQRLFDEITTNFSAEQVTSLALHLQHFNRTKATERALGQRVEAGSNVRIVGGDPRFIGKLGTVDRAQRIRCYVNVPGFKRPVYLFTSDVELVEIQYSAMDDTTPEPQVAFG